MKRYPPAPDLAPARSDVNTICLLSGDHAGNQSFAASVVSRAVVPRADFGVPEITVAILRVGAIEGDEGAIGRDSRLVVAVGLADVSCRFAFPVEPREQIVVSVSATGDDQAAVERGFELGPYARRDVADTLEYRDGFAEKNGAFGVELLGEQPSVALVQQRSDRSFTRGNIGGVRLKRHHSPSAPNRWIR